MNRLISALALLAGALSLNTSPLHTSPLAAQAPSTQPPSPQPPSTQPPSTRSETRAVSLPNGTVARLDSTFSLRRAESEVALRVGDRDPTPLAGDPGAATVLAGHGVVVVAYLVEHSTRPFRVRVAAGPGFQLGEETRIARPTRRRDFPFAVAIAETPEGFSIFFQEVQGDDPSAAHTYLVMLDAQGRPTGNAREIPVPWSLGAAAWNGRGYHLGLLFPGNGQGMRLSMVSLSEAGQPEQHPDWASAAGYIADVHLLARSGRIRAFYRGGPGGDRILESDVTEIRGWGSEPPRARDHGRLGASEAILVTGTGSQLRARRLEAR
ncbi:MAG: hypothetical protein AAGF12_36060 [Myxococcota bacterium]